MSREWTNRNAANRHLELPARKHPRLAHTPDILRGEPGALWGALGPLGRFGAFSSPLEPFWGALGLFGGFPARQKRVFVFFSVGRRGPEPSPKPSPCRLPFLDKNQQI